MKEANFAVFKTLYLVGMIGVALLFVYCFISDSIETIQQHRDIVIFALGVWIFLSNEKINKLERQIERLRADASSQR